jgi:hypothetical protein
MMIEDFDYYRRQNLAKREVPNIGVAKSLFSKARRRIKRIETGQISEQNSDLIFEDAYEACREACQSLMARDGYKPLSHEALLSFLVKFYKNDFPAHIIAELDRYRKLRNLSVYEARQASIDDAKLAVILSGTIIKIIDGVL